MVRTLSRRRLIFASGVAVTLGVAGCTENIDETEARVTTVDPTELTDPGTEPIQVRVLVHNIGVSTDVEITLEVIDLDGEVVKTVTETERFDRDEQRNVTIELTPGPDADFIGGEAEAL